MRSKPRTVQEPSTSQLEELRAAGLLGKLTRLSAGRVVRCSRAACAKLQEITGLPLVLQHHEASAWKGYIVRPAHPRDAGKIVTWLQERGISKAGPKSLLERQRDWQRRAEQSGMRKLATYLGPEAARDLEAIIESLGGRGRKGAQREAVEVAIMEKAARLRQGKRR